MPPHSDSSPVSKPQEGPGTLLVLLLMCSSGSGNSSAVVDYLDFYYINNKNG